MFRFQNRWLVPQLLLIVLSLVIASENNYCSRSNNDGCQKPKSLNRYSKSTPIRIGMVSCIGQKSKPDRYNSEHPGGFDFLNMKRTNTMMVLIKSAIISASLHNVPSLEFRIFLDNQYLEAWVTESMTTFQKMFPHIDIQHKVHYTFDNFPVMTHFKDFVSANWCQYVRLFFPYTLPDVDKILYMDTDMLVTGSIQRLWDYFDEMDSEQMCGLAPNTELEDTNYEYLFTEHFGDVPYVAPRGVNSGLMMMDLEKMRKFDWADKVLSTHGKYSKTRHIFQDQKLVNIIFHNYPDKLKRIPCTFNFIHTNCDKGLTCRAAEKDSEGIHIFHGANTMFSKPDGPFYQLFRSYLEYNATDKTNEKLKSELQLPLKLYYSLFNTTRTCSGTIKKVLFKSLDVSKYNLQDLLQGK